MLIEYLFPNMLTGESITELRKVFFIAAYVHYVDLFFFTLRSAYRIIFPATHKQIN